MSTVDGRRCAILIGLLLTCGFMLAVNTGCNDDSAAMAQQMASQRGSRSPNRSSGADATAGTASGAKTGGETATGARGVNGAAGANGAATGVPEATKEEPPQKKVDVEVIEIKAPYPEYTGKGRYDIAVSVVAKEMLDPAVWRIVAVDDKGKEVGHIDRYVKIPMEIAKNMRFNGFYCSAMPSKVEFRLTDKEAVKPDEGEAGGKAGGGASGTGRGAAGAAGGGGAGGAAGGGAGGGGGAGKTGGGDGGGDEGDGGGDGGGSEE